MQVLTDVIRSLLSNGKSVGSDGVSAELFKTAHNGDPPCDGDCSISSLHFWRGGKVPQQWKDVIVVLHRKKDRTECGTHSRGHKVEKHYPEGNNVSLYQEKTVMVQKILGKRNISK